MSGSSDDASAGASVLVVEDSADLGFLLVTALEVEGLVARWVPTAAEAREVLATGARFDVAVVDLHLPDAEGGDLGLELRAAHGGLLRLVAYSGDAEQPAGFDVFVRKPAGVADVVAAIRGIAADSR